VKQTPREILDAAARTRVPDDLDLYPRISAHLQKKSPWQSLRVWPALLILSVLLVFGLLSGVAYAVGRNLGFFPGVGLVEPLDTIYILVTPVSVSRDGRTVTVNRLVSDSQRTFIAYRVDGISPDTSGFPICTDPPKLELPDGTILDFTSGGGGGMESENGSSMRFETSYTFPPLPTQTSKVVFISPCQMPPLQLALVPAPAGIVTPAWEIGATYQATGPEFASPAPSGASAQATMATPEPYPTSLPATPTRVLYGSGLYLERVIELAHSYILIGNFTDAGDLPGALLAGPGSAYEYLPKIEDADGNSIPFKVRQDIQPETRWGGVYYWAYEVQKAVNLPLKITLDQVNIDKTDTARFQVDIGPIPQVGQKWVLSLPLRLGGKDYVVDQVEMLRNGFLVSWHAEGDIPERTSFTLSIQGLPPSLTNSPSGTEDRHKDRVNYTQEFLTDGPLPTGLVSFELTVEQIVELPGPWILTWALPGP
jgi:hypothetical protein